MSEMIERMAKAGYEAMVKSVGMSAGDPLCPWDEQPEMLRRHWRDAMRAAVVAMMGDPGHDITAAVCEPTDDRRWAVKAWSAMIGACLK